MWRVLQALVPRSLIPSGAEGQKKLGPPGRRPAGRRRSRGRAVVSAGPRPPSRRGTWEGAGPRGRRSGRRRGITITGPARNPRRPARRLPHVHRPAAGEQRLVHAGRLHESRDGLPGREAGDHDARARKLLGERLREVQEESFRGVVARHGGAGLDAAVEATFGFRRAPAAHPRQEQPRQADQRRHVTCTMSSSRASGSSAKRAARAEPRVVDKEIHTDAARSSRRGSPAGPRGPSGPPRGHRARAVLALERPRKVAKTIPVPRDEHGVRPQRREGAPSRGRSRRGAGHQDRFMRKPGRVIASRPACPPGGCRRAQPGEGHRQGKGGDSSDRLLVVDRPGRVNYSDGDPRATNGHVVTGHVL